MRQCVRNNLACPVSDAVQFRHFSFDFFEFGKKGFALRFKPCAFCFQRRALFLVERRRKPQRLHELFAQPDCFLQSAQFVAVFGFVLFAFAAPVDALVFLLNRLQFLHGLNRAKQRVDISDSTFLCRGFRLDFGKYLFRFGDVPSELTDRVKLVIREEGNRLKAVLQIMDSAFFLCIAIPCFAPILSHVQIGGNHIAQRVIVRAFDDLLAADRLAQFIQPSADPANGFLQRSQHLIHADDLSILVAAFAGNALAFQRGSCRTEMLLRQAVFNALPLQ